MLRELLINFCVTVTLAYGLSLTFREWPIRLNAREVGLRMLAVSLVAPILMLFPVSLHPGIQTDLRFVPTVLTTILYGPVAGLVITVPALLYRTFMGGIGVLPAYISTSLVLLTGTAIYAYKRPNLLPRNLGSLHWGWYVVAYAPHLAPLLFIPGGLEDIKAVKLPLWASEVTASVLAVSILQARLQVLYLNSILRRQAVEDGLSGLANRRQFDLDLPNLSSEDALLMLDLDHFKSVNDSFGHQAGDAVLQAVGQALPLSLRLEDRAFRYGGEEFAVILRNVDAGRAFTVGERIREQIADLTLPEIEGRELSVSIGVAMAQPGAPKETMARADSALYAAKHSGRNRTCVWTPDLEPAPAEKRHHA